MTPFVVRVLADLVKCKTPADYYRVQIDINRHATLEDVALLSTRPIQWSQEFDHWLDNLAAAAALARPEPAPYQLVTEDRAYSLYAGPSRAPGLVLSFCGKAGLLLMPVAIVLQYFSPAEFDVAVVRKPLASGRGDNGAFRRMVEKIGAAVELGRYQEVRTFGTSAGGVAALAAGVLIGAPRAASFAGQFPDAGDRRRDLLQIEEIETILRDADPPGEFSCVYGADNHDDTRYAVALSRLLALRQVPIAGVHEHNIIAALHNRGLLAQVFAEVGLT